MGAIAETKENENGDGDGDGDGDVRDGDDAQGDGEDEGNAHGIAVHASDAVVLSASSMALRLALTPPKAPRFRNGVLALRYADEGLPPLVGCDRVRLLMVAEAVSREGGAYGGDDWIEDGKKFAAELGILSQGTSEGAASGNTKRGGSVRQEWPLFRRWSHAPRLLLLPSSVPYVGLKN